MRSLILTCSPGNVALLNYFRFDGISAALLTVLCKYKRKSLDLYGGLLLKYPHYDDELYSRE